MTAATAPFRGRRAIVALLVVGVVALSAGAVRVGRRRVERRLAASVASLLGGSGVAGSGVAGDGVVGGGVRAEVRGQTVTLRGRIADDPRRQVLLQQVRDIPGVVGVRDRLTVAKTPRPAAADTTGPAVLRAEFVNRSVVLSGVVPANTAKSDVIDPVAAVLGVGKVEDRLVTGSGVDPGYVIPFGRVVALAGSAFEQGSVVLSQNSIVLLGTVATYQSKQSLVTEAAALSRTWRVVDAVTSRAPITPTSFDPSSVQSVQAKLDAQQSLLDNLVAGVPVRFDANGRLDALSAVVLDEVARLFSAEEVIEATVVVRADPVAFSDVDEALAWSQGQAQRVVDELKDRGVQAGRLSAQGVGLEPPRADEPSLAVRLVVAPPVPPTTVAVTDTTSPDTTVAGATKKRKRSTVKSKKRARAPVTAVPSPTVQP